LDFGELPIVKGGVRSSMLSFSLDNTCDAPVKFTMPDSLKDVTFSPSAGHIVARGTLNVVATFRPSVFNAVAAAAAAAAAGGTDNTGDTGDTGNTGNNTDDTGTLEAALDVAVQEWAEAVEHTAVELDVTMQRIAYTSTMDVEEGESPPSQQVQQVTPPPWHTNMKSLTYDEGGAPVEVVMVEPSHTVDGDPSVIKLKVTARADKVQYTCAQPKVSFRPTMMFQTRVYRFTVKNEGAVTFRYDWTLTNDGKNDNKNNNKNNNKNTRLLTVDNSRSSSPTAQAPHAPPPCPFEILPPTGSVPPGTSMSFTVRYAPLEVPFCRDAIYRYTAHANLQDLANTTPPLQVEISAQAQR